MTQDRKNLGRPREWVLNEEIIEIHRLAAELKIKNPQVHWSQIEGILKKQLELRESKDLLSKIDKIIGLMKQVIPAPGRCICGRRVYSYTYNKVENEREHYWEVFARCVNPDCRYMRRYLPDTNYKWSRPASIIKELAKIPTFYEMDGQQVEEPSIVTFLKQIVHFMFHLAQFKAENFKTNFQKHSEKPFNFFL